MEEKLRNHADKKVNIVKKPTPKVDLGFEATPHKNTLPKRQHAFDLNEDQMGGAYNVAQYLHDCGNIIASSPINIDEEKILDLLQIKYRWQKDFLHVISHSGIVNEDFFDSNGHFINYDMWKRYYDAGFTTLIFNVLDLTKELREINEKLLPIRGSHTLANFYLSRGTDSRRPSFDVHTHDYNVIVKPIYGRVHWRVNGEDIIADPISNPKNLIVIPAWTEHQVIATNEPKLSLTFNLTA
tara:strand:+ start:259 stop:978 length:720 start_codon:yes stop_codon:yes gene_type:complete